MTQELTAASISDWFDGYNETFGACARGELTAADVLAYYGDGVLITGGDTVIGPGAEAARAWVEAQAAQMSAASYSHTEVLGREITVLNPVTALLRGDFSRRATNGDEVSAFTVTYLIYRSSDGLRVAALTLHG
ncbi:MAG: DUF6841 family protein [Marmoricola sp.]